MSELWHVVMSVYTIEKEVSQTYNPPTLKKKFPTVCEIHTLNFFTGLTLLKAAKLVNGFGSLRDEKQFRAPSVKKKLCGLHL